jgi:hypothetical protein
MILSEVKEIFDKINKGYNEYDVFIETGTFRGETVANVKDVFNTVISIEIVDALYQAAHNQFKAYPNVEIIKNDCVLELPKLIERYNDKKVVYFLDGHYSAGVTGKNDKDVPLLDELKIINDSYKQECLIIIDDADLFEFKDRFVSWVGINEENIMDMIGDRVINSFYTPNLKPANSNKKRLIMEIKAKENE